MNYAYYITLNAKMQLAFSRFFKKTREFSRFSPFCAENMQFCICRRGACKRMFCLGWGQSRNDAGLCQ
ncbi:MAG: hypothetical protein ACLVHV_12995 [Oscillospiraceae bacterium]